MIGQTCTHSSWLIIEQAAGHDLRVNMTDRFQRLHEQLATINPSRAQSPGIWLFLGRESRARAIRSIYGKRIAGPPNSGSAVDLHLPARRAFSDNPVLIAQADLRPACWTKNELQPCHQVRSWHVDVGCDTPFSPLDVIYGRFLSQYIESCCIFCADYGERFVLDQIACWIGASDPPDIPLQARPHLILVVEQQSSTLTRDQVANSVLRHGGRSLELLFCGVSVVSLSSDGSRDDRSVYTSLDGLVGRAARDTRRARGQFRYDFAAPTLASLWHYHLDHLSSSSSDTFNKIRHLAHVRSTTADFAAHLTTFFQLFRSRTNFEDEICILALLLYKEYASTAPHRKCGRPLTPTLQVFHRARTRDVFEANLSARVSCRRCL